RARPPVRRRLVRRGPRLRLLPPRGHARLGPIPARDRPRPQAGRPPDPLRLLHEVPPPRGRAPDSQLARPPQPLRPLLHARRDPFRLLARVRAARLPGGARGAERLLPRPAPEALTRPRPASNGA